MAHGDDGLEPTLVVKGGSLQLKYLALQSHVTIVVTRLSNGGVAYAVRIDEDPIQPAYWWSAVSDPAEVEALAAIADGRACAIHLFKYLIVSVHKYVAGADNLLHQQFPGRPAPLAVR